MSPVRVANRRRDKAKLLQSWRYLRRATPTHWEHPNLAKYTELTQKPF
ncbi:MAG: hypothetical protein V7K98_23210 [Nostoc sp.]